MSSSDSSQKSLAEKTLEDVLLHFGETLKAARRRYRQFIKNGIEQSTRPELQGGGLVRSAGGTKAGLLGRKKEEREKGDERILGSDDFVETILGNSSDTETRRKTTISLELLSRKVASHFNLKEDDLRSPVKSKSIVEAKSAFGYIAIKQMRYSGREVGRFLNMRSYSAIRRAQEGERILDKMGFLWDLSQE
jgi:putative transposase